MREEGGGTIIGLNSQNEIGLNIVRSGGEGHNITSGVRHSITSTAMRYGGPSLYLYRLVHHHIII